MKTIRQRALIVITTLFAVSVALLWVSASPKVTGQIRRTSPLGFLEGLFQAPWRGFDTGTFDHGFGPASFAVGDLNGDGHLDILVGNQRSIMIEMRKE